MNKLSLLFWALLVGSLHAQIPVALRFMQLVIVEPGVTGP